MLLDEKLQSIFFLSFFIANNKVYANTANNRGIRIYSESLANEQYFLCKLFGTYNSPGACVIKTAPLSENVWKILVSNRMS